MLPPILWNKFESANESGGISLSELGVNGIVIGTSSYVAGKFGDGRNTDSASKTLKFTTPLTNTQLESVFTYCFFWKPNYSSGTTPGAKGLPGWVGSGGNELVEVAYDYSSTARNKMIVWVGHYPLDTTAYLFNPTFTAGTWYHIEVVVDQSQGNYDKLKLYIDGNRIPFDSIYSGENNPWYFSGGDNHFYSYSASDSIATDAVIDNPMIFDYIVAESDLAILAVNETWNVGPATTPTGLTASQDQIGKIIVSWDAVSGSGITYQIQRATSSGGIYADISGWISAITYTDTISSGSYWYKVKAKNTYGESALSSAVEGISLDQVVTPIIPPVQSNIPHTTTNAGSSKVFILGQLYDIYKLGKIEKFPLIKQEKTFGRMKTITNELQLTVKNYDNFFSVDNSQSAFRHYNWRFDNLEIISKKNTLIWSGIIDDIQRDHGQKTAVILSKSPIYQYQDCLVDYISADWESPAKALINIFKQIEFSGWDSLSFVDAHNRQTADGLLVKCRFYKTNDVPIIQILDKLSDIGVACSYTFGGKQYYRYFLGPLHFPANISIQTKDFIVMPTIAYDTGNLYNDYSIRFNGDNGVALTDTDAGNFGSISRKRYGSRMLPAIDGSESSDVIIKDAKAAAIIGKNWMRKGNKSLSSDPTPIEIINFSTRDNILMDLNTWFTLTFPDEAWINKLFEIYSVEEDYDGNQVNYSAYEIDTGD